MASKTRDELKAKFQPGQFPTKTAFHDLIDSTLNRRDDRFFGLWVRGKRYSEGDVVIYGKSLYLLELSNADPDCETPEDKSAAAGGAKTETPPKAEAPKCICSDCEPDQDDRWCELQLEIKDDDWECILDKDTGQPTYVYQLEAKVGIGTSSPQVPLEISSKSGNNIQFDPEDAAGTLIRLTSQKADGGYRTDWQQDERSQLKTTSLGYAFFQEPQIQTQKSGKERKGVEAEISPLSSSPVLLMVLNSDDQQRPAAGIGTDNPQGVLEVEDHNRGRMVVNHRKGGEDATILLLNTKPQGTCYYLLKGVNQDYAYLQTDAHQGLRFIIGNEYDSLKGKMGEGLMAMVIGNKGNVGIGIEKGRSKLDVHEDGVGSIRADFSDGNVCLSLINEESCTGTSGTYHALGVDDDFGILSTDAPCGFAFKAGQKYGDTDNQVSPDRGQSVAYLTNEGRLGLQTNDFPREIDLEVNGFSRDLANFQVVDPQCNEIGAALNPEETLECVLQLTPVYYQSTEARLRDTLGRQIGFSVKQERNFPFPELLFKGKDKICSMAYGNMTAVLTAAMQAQQSLIEKLEGRISDLEEEIGKSNNKA